ncbi:T9SS type A sorting domain-containing protein [Ichthyenterobacterium sp. W332]|uniref:T9SS type A sorting domain-containing protein n=1 Tax=Microcosmobacter mediterraneus TaxID=3075607 RepID=A0ABU2YP70_9FLAO|nr:T9SS type A sorting domain-containing protein [Ichthyenterobacterium sp. W332]MDT0559045.1 T9SS type A sorting domain-containing protein [Ichthyenterobacterium sp. W332]
MKYKLLLLTLIITTLGYSQNAPIDFETGGLGASWTWTVFENDTDPALEIIANPVSSGINTSATVAKFTALQTGAPFAGCESMHGADIGSFMFDTNNSTIKIMVYKSVISDVGLKFADVNSAALVEIKVPNTVVNEWEELTFDFSPYIGLFPQTVDQIIIFPDFDNSGRTQDNIIYFDNITFDDQIITPAPMVPAPTPTIPEANVISVFNTNNPYTDITGVDYNPFWGQSTVTTQIDIMGNNTLKYAGLDYQGTDFSGNVQDVSSMSYIHVDYWSSDATALQFFLINQSTGGAGEKFYDFAVEDGITNNTWVSKDIPLTHFTNQGFSLLDIMQFKVVGNGTIYFDNLIFSTQPLSVNDFSDLNVSTYPNPTSDLWTIEVSNSLIKTVTITDILGKTVDFIEVNSDKIQINASSLSSDIYFAKITTDQGSQTIKLLKN